MEILTFDFSLGLEEFKDYKLNHRYPNKGYQTISKKYGRKVSKLGYPYIMKLNEQIPMLLCIKVGIKDQYTELIFPILTNMTKEKPVCGLTLRYSFDDHKFCLESHERVRENGLNSRVRHSWANYQLKEDGVNRNILFKMPHRVSKDSNVLLYNDVIEPCAVSLPDLLL